MHEIVLKAILYEKPGQASLDQFFQAMRKVARAKFGNNYEGISLWTELEVK